MSTNPFSNWMSFSTAHSPRAYVNSAVRFHHHFTPEQRLQRAMDAGWNVFQFPSEMLLGGDLLSDSGTTTLTVEQISSMFLGDEAYGSNYGYFELLKTIEKVFGLPKESGEFFLFHQGRAAEHALFTQVGKWGEGLMIPSNGHFDTTRANLDANRIKGVDFFLPATEQKSFKGNMDVVGLKQFLKEHHSKIPMVFLTITNNTNGGQPVSLENIRAVRALCDEYGLPLFLDACRFAENIWFIKNKEARYAKSTISEIVHEVFSLCDGFTISFKKDGLSNMGGGLFIRKNSSLLKKHPELVENLRDHQILVEGHPTYGGLSGMDLMVISVGLQTVVQEAYLNSRIGQVQIFGQYLLDHHVPVLTPFGGHAIYIDIDQFFSDTKHKPNDFPGIAFTGLLLLKGVRLCELGHFAFGRFDPKTKKEILPAHNFVRAAIPRNKYEKEDLLYVADCIIELFKQRHQIPKAVPIYGRELSLRHFKAKFRLEDF